MRSRRITLLLVLLFINICSFEQDETVDSLKTVLSSLGDSPQKVDLLLQLSQEYQSTSLTDAVAYADSARDLAARLSYRQGVGNSYRFLGNYYKRLGKYPESIDAYSQGLEVFTETKDLVGQSIMLNNFGSLYTAQGQEAKALDYYFKALKLGEEAKDNKRIVTTLSNIGNIYLNNGATNKKALEKALEYFLRALPIANELKDDQIIGTVTVNIGEVYMNDDKYDSALFYFRQSLNAFANTGDVCYTLNDIGTLYERTEKYDSALTYHQRALTIATNLGSQEDMAGSLLGIAQIYFGQHKISDALSAYQKAKDIATALDLKYQLREAYKGLTACYEQMHDYANSFKYQSLLLAVKDSIYSNETNEKLARIEFNSQIEKKQTEIDLLTKDKLLKESELRRQTTARNAVSIGLILVFIIAFILLRGYRNKVKTNKILDQQKEEIENLVLNILPAEVAQELKENGHAEPKYFDFVSVLFTDFRSFTKIADELSPQEVVTELNECFIAFDDIIEKYGLEKIKTIGDAYMCAGGIPTKNEDHPLKIVKASFEIMEFVKARNNRRHALGLPPWDLRIGIHVGPLVAGVVGRKKYAYDIWGSTVNIASRMENNGEPGHVNVSSAIFELVKDRYQCTYRGKIYAKNIGEIDMYFIEKELSEKQEIRPLVDEPATVPTSV
jgi:class 3 adenylate cyclase